MNTRAAVFIATSLDGFIARADGAIDWLPTGDPQHPDEDFGYAAFMASIDVLVMGRKTFQTVLGFGSQWPQDWPYGNKPVVVLSTRLHDEDIPTGLRPHVEVHPGPVPALLQMLGQRGHAKAYVDGGQTIQAFLREDAVDELTLTRVPVLLGQGIPLFGSLPMDRHLRHLETRSFANGLVQSRYRVQRSGTEGL